MVVLMIALSIFAWRRRIVPGARQLMIACLFAAAWAACLLMNYAALDTSTKILWLKVQAIVQLPIIIAITCFILEYAWPGREAFPGRSRARSSWHQRILQSSWRR